MYLLIRDSSKESIKLKIKFIAVKNYIGGESASEGKCPAFSGGILKALENYKAFLKNPNSAQFNRGVKVGLFSAGKYNPAFAVRIDAELHRFYAALTPALLAASHDLTPPMDGNGKVADGFTYEKTFRENSQLFCRFIDLLCNLIANFLAIEGNNNHSFANYLLDELIKIDRDFWLFIRKGYKIDEQKFFLVRQSALGLKGFQFELSVDYQNCVVFTHPDPQPGRLVQVRDHKVVCVHDRPDSVQLRYNKGLTIGQYLAALQDSWGKYDDFHKSSGISQHNRGLKPGLFYSHKTCTLSSITRIKDLFKNFFDYYGQFGFLPFTVLSRIIPHVLELMENVLAIDGNNFHSLVNYMVDSLVGLDPDFFSFLIDPKQKKVDLVRLRSFREACVRDKHLTTSHKDCAQNVEFVKEKLKDSLKNSRLGQDEISTEIDLASESRARDFTQEDFFWWNLLSYFSKDMFACKQSSPKAYFSSSEFVLLQLGFHSRGSAFISSAYEKSTMYIKDYASEVDRLLRQIERGTFFSVKNILSDSDLDLLLTNIAVVVCTLAETCSVKFSPTFFEACEWLRKFYEVHAPNLTTLASAPPMVMPRLPSFDGLDPYERVAHAQNFPIFRPLSTYKQQKV